MTDAVLICMFVCVLEYCSIPEEEENLLEHDNAGKMVELKEISCTNGNCLSHRKLSTNNSNIT